MLKVELLDKQCLPSKKNNSDAGYDLRSANENFELEPGEKIKVHTGIKVEIPHSCCGMIVPRSGLGTKYEVALANTVGIIDPLYRGEILVWLTNKGKDTLYLNKYDRFCQMLIVPVRLEPIRVVSQVRESRRGTNGFGSSGVK